jgi:GNAT superfamily N-acetyltransferase
MRMASPSLQFHPLNATRWNDLLTLFGERGACGGCWCMFWRVPRKQFDAGKGELNKRAFKKIASSELPPGVLAYAGDEVIGWCAVAPREVYIRLLTSRILKPVDDKPVWSVSCLFIRKDFRRRGVSTQLVRAAVAFAATRGARTVEGYPVETSTAQLPDPFLWHGTSSAFRKAGFKEVLRRSATRPIMRYEIK